MRLGGDGEATRTRFGHLGDGDVTRVLLVERVLALCSATCSNRVLLEALGLLGDSARVRLDDLPLRRRGGAWSRLSTLARPRDVRRALALICSLALELSVDRLLEAEDTDEGLGMPSLPTDDVRWLTRGGRDMGVPLDIRESTSSSSLISGAGSYRGGSTGNQDESSLIGLSIHEAVLAFVSKEPLVLRLVPSRFFGRRRDFSSLLACSIPEG